MNTRKDLEQYGKNLVGKTAQSHLLTYIGQEGYSRLSPAQKITGFKVVEVGRDLELMVTINSFATMEPVEVFESTLFNIN